MSNKNSTLREHLRRAFLVAMSAAMVFGGPPGVYYGMVAFAQECTSGSQPNGNPPGQNRRKGSGSGGGESPVAGSTPPFFPADTGSSTTSRIGQSPEWTNTLLPVGFAPSLDGSSVSTTDSAGVTATSSGLVVQPTGGGEGGKKGGIAHSEERPFDGDVKPAQETTGDPVVIVDGELKHQEYLHVTDELEVYANYSSKRGYEGRMGYNWFPSYRSRVVKLRGGKLLHLRGDGSSTPYTYDESRGIYVANAGNFKFLEDSTTETGGFVVTDPRGKEWRYNAEGLLVSMRVKGRTVTYQYLRDGAGDLVKTAIKQLITTELGGTGVVRTIGRDYQLESITDFAGRALSLGYDGNGRLQSINDYSGRTWDYVVAADGTLTSIADPTGAMRSFTYYRNFEKHSKHLDRNLKSVTDARGNVILTLFYDQFDRVTGQIAGTGTWTFDYDDYTTTVTDARGLVTVHDFTPDEIGKPRLTSARRITMKDVPIAGGDVQDIVKEFRNDADSSVTWVKMPNGAVATAVRDSWSNLLEDRMKPTDGPDGPDDIVTTFEYEERYHSLVKRTGPRGYSTEYFFDYMEDEEKFNVDFNGDGNILNADLNGDGLTNQDFGNVIRITYPAVTVHVPGGSPTQQTSQRILRYNELGDLTQTVSAIGTVEESVYYGPTETFNGVSLYGFRKAEIDDVGGLSLTTTYTKNWRNRITRITQPRGNWTDFEYDAMGRLTRSKSCPIHHENAAGTVVELNDGYESLYQFDGNGNVIVESIEDDHLGEMVTVYKSYDVLNRLVQIRYRQNGAWVTNEYTRDSMGDVIQGDYPGGEIRRTVRDLRGLPIVVTQAFGTPEALAERIEYDVMGQQVATIDALSRVHAREYNQFGRLTRLTMPDGTTVNQEYNESGDVVHSVTTGKLDLAGVVGTMSETWMVYDESDQLVETRSALVDPLSPSNDAVASVRTAYNQMGEVELIEGHLGHVERIEYDSVGRVSRKTDRRGNVLQWTYDANGCTTHETAVELDPSTTTRTVITESVFDELNRIYKVISAAGDVSRLTLTSRDKIASATDANGNTVSNTYDRNTLLTSTTRWFLGPAGLRPVTTSYAYNSSGELVSVTDDNGSKTRYSLDIHGRITVQTFGADSADETTDQFFYDAVGNPIRTIDQEGHVTDVEFDSMNRPTKTTYHDGMTEEDIYDGAGRSLKSTTSSGNAIDVIYDSFGRTIRQLQNGKQFDYSWDLDGGSIGVIYPDGTSITRTRDELSRPVEIKVASASVARYTYAGTNRVAEREYPQAGVFKSVSYTSDDEVILHEHRSGSPTGSIIQGFAYGYDRSSNRIWSKRTHNGSVGDRYTYDEMDRLRRVAYDASNPELGEAGASSFTDYSLDGVGNRTSVEQDGQSTAYTVSNPHNEYDAVGGVSRSHDKRGNLTGDGSLTYNFDTKNQLTAVHQVATGALVANYAYDAAGRRISKSSPSGVTHYYYDGVNVALEYFVPSGGSEAVSARYVYGGGIDELLMSERDLGGGFVRHYYIEDGLGSIVGVLDSAGATVERYQFDIFGKLRLSKDGAGTDVVDSAGALSTAIGNPYFFAGRRVDAESGLYYLRARFYDPVTGRFLSRDSLGYVDGMNLYEYARSNPVNFTDPLGHSATTDAMSNAYNDVLSQVHINGASRKPRKRVKKDIRNFAKMEQRMQKLAKYLQNAKYKETAERIVRAMDELGEKMDKSLQDFQSNLTKLHKNHKSLVKSFIHSIMNASLLDMAQMALDVIGALNIPGISDLADAASLGIDVATGKLTLGQALAFGAIAAIPGVSAAGAKLIFGAARGAKKAAGGLFSAVKKSFAHLKCKTNKLRGRQPQCFVAGTLVATAVGLVPIESIQAGDEVLAMDPRTGESAFKQVTRTVERQAVSTFRLSMESGAVLGVTGEHPFYLADGVGGWVPAERLYGRHVSVTRLEVLRGSLRPGGGAVVEVARLSDTVSRSARVTRQATVYNLMVEDWHCYFVTNELLLVHNGYRGGRGNLSGKRPPINKNRQRLHSNGRAGKSQFKQGLDVDHLVKDAWHTGKPVFDKNGRFIHKIKTYKVQVGALSHQRSIKVSFSRKNGIHGWPSSTVE